ncbi:Sigma-B activity negative regulator [Planktothrix sp. PCC 11201]|uniref:ATP-binding protein n=1 Tax=Planktothrix sp. PCC 11201 TaxID=1729650 RepID=UPI00091BBF9A|nr:ATP-binding protein [Planktothrix sp. PCC 11201]SKB13157.1 Sigma-B activity negative regulator [Planktothrix sp. PCC 11201]
MPLPQITQLQVPSSLDSLAKVLSWFDQLYQSFIPKSVWLRCQLALAEGFTNAVRHAHQGLSSDLYIDLEVTILDRQIEIRIWDFGVPFDLMKKIKDITKEIKDTPTDSDPPLGGGGTRGLLLMRDIADYLSYEHGEDGRNCLLIIKQF